MGKGGVTEEEEGEEEREEGEKGEEEREEEEEEEYATEVPSGGGSFELCYDEQGNQYLYGQR